MKNWNLTYLGPSSFYQDFIGGKVYHAGRAEIVDEDTKVRLTENTRRVVNQDLWEAELVSEELDHPQEV